MDPRIGPAFGMLVAGALAAEEEAAAGSSRKWMKKWLQRSERGSYQQIFSELSTEERQDFINYCRMPPEIFFMLLNKISPVIEKSDTIMRESIPAGARLEATLRWLSNGGSYTSLQYSTRISKQSLSVIIPETCAAIYSVLKDEYVKTPSSATEWKRIAEDFNTKWQFPNCLGALDGKHILIRPPPNSGSYYFNYKGTHSIILLALVDANLEFIYADIGVNGRASDSSAWEVSQLRQGIENNSLNIPAADQLPGSQKVLPYVIVADDAFPLKKNLMKPFPFRNQSPDQRVFSYRLSRARRTVENAFGILSNRFRVLLNPINLKPSKVECVVLACISLHNMLRKTNPESDPNDLIDSEQLESGVVINGSWHQQGGLLNLQSIARNSSQEAKEVRIQYSHYFNNEGSVPWQNNF